MALTIDALKGLFKKLGGSDSGFAGVNTIPEAIDKVTSVASSGGGDEYETVAEIAVGTMEHDDWYTYEEENVTTPEISSDITYYLNDEKMPSETVMDEGGMYGITWNIEDTEEGKPIDPKKPFVIVAWMNGGCRVMSDTDFSNTTVKILKKVSGGGEGTATYTPYYDLIAAESIDGSGNKRLSVNQSELSEAVLAAGTGKTVRLIVRNNNNERDYYTCQYTSPIGTHLIFSRVRVEETDAYVDTVSFNSTEYTNVQVYAYQLTRAT